MVSIYICSYFCIAWAGLNITEGNLVMRLVSQYILCVSSMMYHLLNEVIQSFFRSNLLCHSYNVMNL